MAVMTAEETELIDQMRNYKVTKSNALIQKTRFSLSLQEQKIIAYLISKIEPSDSDLEVYTFDIRQFCEICGIQADGMYNNLKEVTQHLSDKSFWFSFSPNEEVLLRWISSVRYQKNKGTISIRISEDMRPFLIELKKQFTTYHLYNILAFKSRYSLRMYELLKSYANMHSWTVGVTELKKMLDAEQYVNFKDFRVRVLELSQREINECTDINFTYETMANGRRIEKLTFQISPDFDIIKRIKNLAEHGL